MVTNWVADILSEHGEERVADIRSELQQSMDNNAAVFRTEETLKQALTDIHALQGRYSRISVHDKGSAATATCWRPSNWVSLLGLAEVTVVSALNRKGPAAGVLPARTTPNRDDTNHATHHGLQREVATCCRHPPWTTSRGFKRGTGRWSGKY